MKWLQVCGSVSPGASTGGGDTGGGVASAWAAARIPGPGTASVPDAMHESGWRAEEAPARCLMRGGADRGPRRRGGPGLTEHSRE